jgi:hypothetical protein
MSHDIGFLDRLGDIVEATSRGEPVPEPSVQAGVVRVAVTN